MVSRARSREVPGASSITMSVAAGAYLGRTAVVYDVLFRTPRMTSMTW